VQAVASSREKAYGKGESRAATHRLGKDGTALAVFGPVDEILHLLRRQRRVHHLDLPLEPQPLLRSMLALRLGVAVNHLLEATLDEPDLLFSDVDILEREVVQRLSGGDEDAQVGVALLEDSEPSLDRGEQLASGSGLCGEVVAHFNTDGTLGRRNRQ
jgi:hypothetical protein